MRNFKIAVAFVGAVSAFQAYGQPVAIVSNQAIQAPDCPLLAEDVRIPLSQGVIGARNCASAGNPNAVLVAACHTAGRNGSRTIEVPCDNDANTANIPDCAAPNTSTNRVTNTGAAIIVGSTAGGQVGPQALANYSCDAATVAGRIQ